MRSGRHERGTGEPEPEVLAAQIFHLLLSRLRVDEEDPAWELAPAKPEPLDPVPLTETMLDELWLTACRRFLRRHVRIGLA